MSELYLIRHGQASFGSENYDQLSPLGYNQSLLLGSYFLERNIGFDHSFTGSMRRHNQTLEGIGEGLGEGLLESAQTHTGFNEYDFAKLMKSFSNLHPDDELVRYVAENPLDKKNFYRLMKQALLAWANNALDDVPETWNAFQQRIAEARTMLHELAVTGSRVLVVSSGGAISQFIGSVLNLSPEMVFELNLQMRNTGICHFYCNAHKISLSGFNSVPHLDQSNRVALSTYG